MTTIHIFHNHNFLAYRGDHAHIMPPVTPVATVTVVTGSVNGELPPAAALSQAYRLTQHVERPWFVNPNVQPHLRSTSVGDVLAIGDNYYVVEPMGFAPYLPRAIRPVHRLADACRRLETAVADSSGDALRAEAAQALSELRHVLAAEGYPASETPMLWDDAVPGDLIGSPALGHYRVIARRLRPKWRARRLLAHIPDGQIWIDSPRTWAVVVPVNEVAQT